MKPLQCTHHNRALTTTLGVFKWRLLKKTPKMHCSTLFILITMVTCLLAEEVNDNNIRHLHHKLCKQFWKKMLKNFDGNSEDVFLEWYISSKKQTSTFPTISFNNDKNFEYPKMVQDTDGAPVIDRANEKGRQTVSLPKPNHSSLIQSLLNNAGYETTSVKNSENVEVTSVKHLEDYVSEIRKENLHIKDALNRRHHGKTHHKKEHIRHKGHSNTQTSSSEHLQ
ncbi:uncharacterized protein [Antedon mediterranea]|uniref:uncharacterized protein n=1 Tax=Antedon mediterranea TaxID=105859 RepID=UPI003AF7D257